MYGFEYLKNFLKDEGIAFEHDDDCFFFDFGPDTYYFSENKVPALEIYIVCDTSKYNRSKLLNVCNELNDNWIIFKFVLKNKEVYCSYEFIPDKENTKEDYVKILTLLSKSADEVFENLE